MREEVADDQKLPQVTLEELQEPAVVEFQEPILEDEVMIEKQEVS